MPWYFMNVDLKCIDIYCDTHEITDVLITGIVMLCGVLSWEKEVKKYGECAH